MDELELDATLMNKWLGDKKITDLSPKTLYDIQSLIEYYRDVIVPDKNVKIKFPVEGTPCANPDDMEIEIPYSMLAEGRIDNTIGAMIHELRHIQDTPVRAETVAPIWAMLNTILNSLKLPNGKTLAEVVFSDCSYSLDRIVAEPDEDEKADPHLDFLREAVGLLFGLANACEDVRIDANTPPNLKKYIDGIDSRAWAKFEEAMKNDVIEDWDFLQATIFRFLFHHKGFYKDEMIEKYSPSTQSIIENDAVGAIIDTFSGFRDMCQQEVARLYDNFCPNKSEQGNDGQGNNELDMFNDYVGDMVTEEVQKSIATQAGNAKGFEIDPKDVSAIIENLKEDTTLEAENTSGDKEMSNELCESNGTVNAVVLHTKKTAKEFSKSMNSDHRAKLISAELNTQIQNFKNIQVHTTTEDFGTNQNTTYDCVIFDATKN